MSVQAFLAGFSGLWLYVVIGGLVGLASVSLPGWFVPGQACAVAGGVIASAGGLGVAATMLAVFAGAYIGCGIGYGLGAWFAAAKPGWAPGGRLGRWWLYAVELLGRHAGAAVLAGRWNAALRACVPNAAGASRVGWGRFLGWNALACAIWSPAVVGAGVLAGRAVAAAQTGLGAVSSLVGVAALVLLILGYRRWAGARVALAGPAATSSEGGA
ncbi:MAG: DedA family protein [Bifidobacteriaceae bacterium]|jgi:membrane protein DedA with SNARE-associated domain|nr:DedA family protein [Bifidobacteriaceae bacterium]